MDVFTRKSWLWLIAGIFVLPLALLADLILHKLFADQIRAGVSAEVLMLLISAVIATIATACLFSQILTWSCTNRLGPDKASRKLESISFTPLDVHRHGDILASGRLPDQDTDDDLDKSTSDRRPTH